MRPLFAGLALAIAAADANAQSALDAYVGQYQFTNAVLMVKARDGKLYLRGRELIPRPDSTFGVSGLAARITFVRDAKNRITSLVWSEAGQDFPAPRISSQTERTVRPGDHSPHEVRFVRANGITMEYADWGGRGQFVLLLAGLGNDAHVYDDFAPAFTDRFRVVGLTRRGFADSDRPETGYDVATRVEDIRAFLDSLHVVRAYIVGHSMAGDEMTLFASTYPDRVAKLVYLDAAYDRSGSPRRADDDAIALDEKAIYQALFDAMSSFHPDYTKISASSLAIYSVPRGATSRRSSIDQFRKEMARGEIVEMDAPHDMFIAASRDEVVRRVRKFLLK